MVAQVLACTVKGCGRALEPRGRALACAEGHSFDLARSGYVNLLQPQDRRSATPGDARASLDARARLQAAGVGRHLEAAVIEHVVRLGLTSASSVVELGCGNGTLLAQVAEATQASCIGLDLAVAGIERAARTHPSLTWAVANVDRRLPLVDHGVDLVLSVHARRNPPECQRVLLPTGALVVVIPAPDDLIELREWMLGERVARERASAVTSEHDHGFTLEAHTLSSAQYDLTPDQLRDVLAGTYRGARTSVRARQEELPPMRVTLASEILLFRPRGESPAPR